CGGDRIEDRLGIAEIAGVLEHVDGDFEERMFESDRLRPWPLGRLCIGFGQFARALSGKAGLEQMTRCPPDFRSKPIAARAERTDHRWKQQCLPDSDDLRPKALLHRLRP